MKKRIKLLFLVCLSLIMLIPTNAYAHDNSIPEWEDANISQEEFDRILAPYEKSNEKARTAGLITRYAIGLEKSGSQLSIVGKTICAPGVVKSGFTEIVIQRRKAINDSFSTYDTYYDLYSNSTSYAISKKITPTPGYQYRVTCTHYAKKSLLSTEKIKNTSNIISM